MPRLSGLDDLVLSAPSLLAACATEAGFRKGLDQLKGQPKDQLDRRFGTPTYDGRTEDGLRYVQFNLSWEERGGGYSTACRRPRPSAAPIATTLATAPLQGDPDRL